MKVRVEYCDGHYWLAEAKPGDEVRDLGGKLLNPHIEIDAAEWEAYLAYEALARYWHDRCRGLSNEQYALHNPEPDEDHLEREARMDALEVATEGC